MKICSLYGAGFYYIPGTDTCVKMGGFVRGEWNANSYGSFASQFNNNLAGRSAGSNDALRTRTQQQLTSRARGVISWDIRSQTEYGTLRTYLRGGWQFSDGDPTIGATGATAFLDRAFIQIGGFTFGKSQSFFDFFNTPAYSNQTPFLWADTGGTGTPMLAYTAVFGSGLSASLSLESHNEQLLPIVAVGATGAAPAVSLTGVAGPNFGAGFSNALSNGGNKVPDVVANLRLDQAWGSAQIAGALHNNNAAYYTLPVNTASSAGPSDAIGWALGGGVKLNLPMLGAGDHMTIASNYCKGATRYCSDPSVLTAQGPGYGLRNGSTVAVGWFDDAYYNTNRAAGGSLELPTVWNFIGGYSHNWNAKWNSTLVGVYNKYQANSNAIDTLVCANAINDATGVAGVGAGCTNFSSWQLGSRTTWRAVQNLDISLEVMYTKVDGAMQGARFTSTVQGTPSTLVGGNGDLWSGIFRVQHAFYP
ncbi:MAG: porin [Rhizobiales bacterium]|nr:porin [Hyphomicrobiales bacterium]